MPKKKGSVAFPLEIQEIIKDYRLAYQSRQASLIGRREVLSGKAKFGIFGDGKELANIAIGARFSKRRLALRLLSRSNLDVHVGCDEHPGIFCPALRAR